MNAAFTWLICHDLGCIAGISYLATHGSHWAWPAILATSLLMATVRSNKTSKTSTKRVA